LRKLHKKHLLNIPFENLDIHYGKKIILNKNLLFEKIIISGRGGYCYELNGLFYFLLKAIGFKVKMLSARVSNAKENWGKEYDHLVLLVDLGDLWLADVGFGECFLLPLKISKRTVQKDVNGFYLISNYGKDILKLSRSGNNINFSDEYIFSLKKRRWNEFENMNVYHQTSPESNFTRKKLCTIAVKNGRITLTDKNLIITTNGKRKIKAVKNEIDFKSKLSEYFSINI